MIQSMEKMDCETSRLLSGIAAETLYGGIEKWDKPWRVSEEYIQDVKKQVSKNCFQS